MSRYALSKQKNRQCRSISGTEHQSDDKLERSLCHPQPDHSKNRLDRLIAGMKPDMLKKTRFFLLVWNRHFGCGTHDLMNLIFLYISTRYNNFQKAIPLDMQSPLLEMRIFPSYTEKLHPTKKPMFPSHVKLCGCTIGFSCACTCHTQRMEWSRDINEWKTTELRKLIPRPVFPTQINACRCCDMCPLCKIPIAAWKRRVELWKNNSTTQQKEHNILEVRTRYNGKKEYSFGP